MELHETALQKTALHFLCITKEERVRILQIALSFDAVTLLPICHSTAVIPAYYLIPSVEFDYEGVESSA